MYFRISRYLERTYPDSGARDAVFLDLAQAITVHENIDFGLA